ncbi:MAG: NAD(P)H-dependent oxidoreductase [Chitinophagaceae bacterium]|nr:NAD(P)H-dependent oxidoreductase [Chitinophagaceae bacterium]
MVTIISGTNRKHSNTSKIAREYQLILLEKGIKAVILSLEDLDLVQYNPAFETIENEILIPATHFIIISPEYNGSFPGVLKMLFDTSRSHEIWFHKKALLTGVASGRAGNLRGMDHLADVLNYMKITVHPNKLPISAVNNVVNSDGKIIDNNTLKAINQQLDEFILWASLQPQPSKH